MDKLKEKSGCKLQTYMVLLDNYDLLAVYGAYEVLIACPERFDISTIGFFFQTDSNSNIDSRVSTQGAPDCIVDYSYCMDSDDNNETTTSTTDINGKVIPSPDIIIIPDVINSKYDTDNSLLEQWISKQNIDATLIVRVGPQALDKVVLPSFLQKWQQQQQQQQETPTEQQQQQQHLLRSVSGADMAVYLIDQLAGSEAREKAEEMVEYKGHDPFDYDNLPTPPKTETNNPSLSTSTKSIFTSTKKTIRLGIFIFDGFEMLDTFGPMATFVAANRLYLETCTSGGGDDYGGNNNNSGKGSTKQPPPPLFEFTFYSETTQVQSSRGPFFYADKLLLESSSSSSSPTENNNNKIVDWLLIPGGLGTITENYNNVGKDWVRHIVEQHADRVITVCTGSGYLANMGLLDNHKATTNKLLYDLVTSWGPNVHWEPKARWIHDGKFWTSSGVAAGTDQALAIIEDAFGRDDDSDGGNEKNLADIIAIKMGWYHRVKTGEQDVFVARQVSSMEVLLTNFFMKVLCSWLPKSWTPKPATIDKYLG